MKISVYGEGSLGLELQCIAENVQRLAPQLCVVKGKAAFAIKSILVSFPHSYKQLSPAILRESADSDYVALFTKHPYDNNFFWEELGNKAIISLSGWDHLTSIPPNNGAVFFICAMIMQVLNIGVRHDDNTGCINDFWMDKTGVDLGMRAGCVCAECLAHGKRTHGPMLSQVQTILNDISTASRTGMDICDYWRMRATEDEFDVFLCHNSRDKDAVRSMGRRLEEKDIRTWFDEDQLPPGRLWQELLDSRSHTSKRLQSL
jgi:hypothetical protein